MFDDESFRLSWRIVEAVIFAATGPVSEEELRSYLEPGIALGDVMDELNCFYEPRGVDLVFEEGGWRFTSRELLKGVGPIEVLKRKSMTRSALEILAIILLHQPITAAEIDAMRGKKTASGVVKRLAADGWIEESHRLQLPGEPAAWITGADFAHRIGIDGLDEIPTVDEAEEILRAPPEDPEAPRRFTGFRANRQD